MPNFINNTLEKYLNSIILNELSDSHIELKYVLQKHKAYKAGLHYDFRIELPTNKSKLKSFAIRKFPEKNKDKIYIVETKLHSADWLDIKHLELPEGDYGAGIIDTVQKGKLTATEFSDRKISFNITGKILNGDYSLIRMGNPIRPQIEYNIKGNIWLFIKK